ncbi:MAG: hypothetical protein KGL39_46375 [Patescibacteria group bacterium]|nr:hypothetical protein [Patescibacteria group bacterium]
MTKDVYLFDIARTDDVQWLLALQADVRQDETFNSDEKTEVLEAIRLRVCAINAAAAGPQKPRW